MSPTLYCLADSKDHADRIVSQLQAAGVPAAHISALILSEDPQNRPAPLSGFEYAGAPAGREEDKAAAGATTGTAAGAAAGVMTMGIVGLTPLLMIAPLIVGTGAGIGAAVGATAGAQGSSLADFGIPNEKQPAYEERLKTGGVLLAVRSDDESELEKANTALVSTIEDSLRIAQEGRERRLAATKALAEAEGEIRRALISARAPAPRRDGRPPA